MADDGYGLYWRVGFRCDDDPEWFLGQTDSIVDALATTTLWKELQVYGRHGKLGRSFSSPSPIKKALRAGRTVLLARGGRDATAVRDLPTARVSIEPQQNGLALTAIARSDSLTRLGPLAISEYADVLMEMTYRWRPHARLVEAWATPIARTAPFRYPRVRPPRTTRPYRAPSAIVDVLDPVPAQHAVYENDAYRTTLVGAQAMATAELPAGVERRERNGVVVLQWVNDPSDRAAVEAACTRHERWLLALLPSKTSSGWTDEGDEQLDGYPEDSAPPITVLLHDTQDQRDLYYGHIAIPSDENGEIDRGAWEQVAALASVRQLPDGRALSEVRLLATSRTAALALAPRARAAGFDRVVYQDQDGYLWDPAPPGPWVT